MKQADIQAAYKLQHDQSTIKGMMLHTINDGVGKITFQSSTLIVRYGVLHELLVKELAETNKKLKAIGITEIKS